MSGYTTVLVTGGAGFVGSHLVESLSADHVRVLDDFSTGRRDWLPDDVEVFEGDVADPDTLSRAMAGADCVFHLAAMVSVPESVERPVACQRRNADATTRLLDEARRTDARVVLSSSAAVYGEQDSLPIPETARPRPRSPYGVTKLAGDHQAAVFADLYDLPVVSLRYFNVYGPRGGTNGVVGAFVARALAGETLEIDGDGRQTRDFVHVADVVRANQLAADTAHTGEVFNVGTGRAVSVRRLAAVVADAVDADVSVQHTASRTGDVRDSRADIEKARERLGFEPRIDVETGIERLVAHRRGAREPTQ
jgi:UDP-glucose 4-epimerase